MGGDHADARGTANRGTAARGTKRRVQAITALIDENQVVFTLDDGTIRAVKLSHNGRPQAGRYLMVRDASPGAGPSSRGFVASPPLTGVANRSGLVLAWTEPDGVTFEGVKRYTLTVVRGRTAPGDVGNLRGDRTTIELAGDGGAAKASPQDGSADAHDDAGAGDEAKGTADRGLDDRGTDDPGTATRGTGDDVRSEVADGGGFDADFAMLADPDQVRLAPADEEAWRAIAKLAVGRGEAPPDPVELIRQYRLWVRYVDQQVFSDSGGEQWSSVMKFLEGNQQRIEGKLHATKNPGFSIKALEKLLEEHKRIAPPESIEERDPGDPLRYDPGLAHLSPAERKLLADLARLHPGMVTDGTLKQPYISVLAKVVIALRLTYKLWPREVAEHAEQAFSDPVFVMTTASVLGVYWALWLVPDPTAVTKAAVAALTAVMLYYFSVDVVLAFLRAVKQLFTDCDKTVRIEELEAAGRRFAQAVGKVGFDILLFIVTWRIGKHIEPKLRDYGASREVARAEARAAKIQETIDQFSRHDPATTVPDVLAKARAAAGDRASPLQVLEKLREMLPDDARQGLELMRRKPVKTSRDAAAVLREVEAAAASRTRGDVMAFLRERLADSRKKALDPALHQAEAELVRARINRRRVHDQRVRRAMRRERIKGFLEMLEKRGVLARIASLFKQRLGLDKTPPDTLLALIAESITITELRLAYPESRGFKVLANVEIVRRVEEYKTIQEWKAANPEADFGALRESDGRLWESVTEVDGMAVALDAQGKWRIVEIEQTKATGPKGDSHTKAAAQSDRALAALMEIAAGKSDVAVYMTGARKATLGTDITAMFNWTGLRAVRKSTRGPAGVEPPFDKDLYGMTRDNLKMVAEELLENPTPMDTPLKVLPAGSDDGEARVPPVPGGSR